MVIQCLITYWRLYLVVYKVNLFFTANEKFYILLNVTKIDGFHVTNHSLGYPCYEKVKVICKVVHCMIYVHIRLFDYIQSIIFFVCIW